ncbi:putative phage abortive infection protein [Roseateles sp. LYH14W]|uniref:Phage abortive infection protein n=1 Tax=Pelomonas parva TaxID=3299032 RepID=A0ABW7FA12_9BURK
METKSGAAAIGAMAALVAAVAAWWCWWWFGAAYVVRHWKSDGDPALADLGLAGDMFGGFSALFSALAFVGVVTAAYLQRETIKLQRIQMQRAEAEAQEARTRAREDAARAAAAQARQAFEPLFFQLVELLRSQSDQIQLRVDTEATSTMHFPAALEVVRTRAEETWKRAVDKKLQEQGLAKLSETYSAFYSRNESRLGPYLRTLYHTLKLIDRSELPDDEKVDYANILRGLLSRDELLLVILNCSSGWGVGLKQYIEKYGVLKHITRADDRPTLDEDLARLTFASTATMAYEDRRRHWNGEGWQAS